MVAVEGDTAEEAEAGVTAAGDVAAVVGVVAAVVIGAENASNSRQRS